jgi:hypothetical protein
MQERFDSAPSSSPLKTRTMRQETKVITYYKFDELSDRAKQNAIDKLRDINVDYDWWDYVYDDAETIGVKITGFDIGRGSYCEMEFQDSRVGVAELILKNHGEMCDTYKLAKTFLEDMGKAMPDNYDELEYDEQVKIDDAVDELKDEFENTLSGEYLSMLRQEYEYLTSDEGIIETIECNEYEFDADGDML